MKTCNNKVRDGEQKNNVETEAKQRVIGKQSAD